MKEIKLIIWFIGTIVLFCSCNKILEIDTPKGNLVAQTVFKNDEVATSVVLGIYNKMAASGSSSGDYSSISVLAGLSSDEFLGYSSALQDFYSNQILPENSLLTSLWSSLYQRIYAANSVLEGLDGSIGVTPSTKTQLKGEALFIRAFNYFYLVNLFGSIPLHLSTNYEVNSTSKQNSPNEVYSQIIKDLKDAEVLLGNAYVPINERARPNKSAVRALLARVFLYQNQWENAEAYSTLVLENSTYNLVSLDAVFLKNSNESIWQLMPTASTNSLEGNTLILTTTPIYVSLKQNFALNVFESNDKRQTSWIKSFTNNTGTYYYPYKYKIKSSTAITEYSMVLRLAEQYLIRSEARANLNKIPMAIDDIDKIRSRAGIKAIKDISPNISQIDLLNAIQNERKVELFSEWGHRWLDLKRTNQADAILKVIKPKWESTDVLFPIPKTEVDRNQNIVQNNGY